MAHRIPIVGVMGSGTSDHAERASPLGRWLAQRGVHLLTGGGDGVMAAVSRAFHESPGRRGMVIGILPCEENSIHPKAGYPNEWVELPIYTHLPLSGIRGRDPMSRNHINVLTSDVIIALPGGAGTASEAALALSYNRPIVAYLDRREEIQGLSDDVPVRSSLDEVREFVESALESGMARR